MSKPVFGKQPLKGRDFLSTGDFTAEELYMFWDTAADLKRRLKRGEEHEVLKGKTLAMIFDMPSTRTRVSFETGMQQLGGHALMITSEQYWTKKKESLKDSGAVFARYVDGVIIRTFRFSDIEEFARWCDVPVINAYCEMEHPCQVMADFMTTREKKGKLEGVKTAIVWAFSNFNKSLGIVHSSLYAAPRVGMDLMIACPDGYDPEPRVVEEAKRRTRETGSEVRITRDLKEAVEGADAIHIKGWAPHEIIRMGPEGMDAMSPHRKNPEEYKGWMITEELLDLAKRDVNIQHALPVERNVEALDSILDGPHSVIYDEAENRLHAQKGIMALTMV
ncbi:MAG: ornithine carbamoyltransferase [Candidatus Bathyarchaeia archaeon]